MTLEADATAEPTTGIDTTELIADDDDDKNTTKQDEPAISLDTQLFYQNQATGQASQHPLTVRQFIRILQKKTTTSSSSGSVAPPPLTANTQVLRVGPDGISYVGSWQAVQDVPVLRQVVVSGWYYESAGISGGGDSKNADQQQEVQGPMSCQELANAFRKGELTMQTRVYSESTKEWKHIVDLPELQVALDAFEDEDEERKRIAQQQVTAIDNDSNKESSPASKDVVVDTRVQQELDTFLSSTDHLPLSDEMHRNKLNNDDASYESDNGNRYVKDPRTGNWVHEALAPQSDKGGNNHHPPPPSKETAPSMTEQQQQLQPSKKRKRAKFAARNARCWIYVTGLPSDTNEEEVARVFSKAGIIALDPETQRPRIKLYRYKADNGENKQQGLCKGDMSICFARPESVELAITLLDGTPFRMEEPITTTNERGVQNMKIERAKFQQRGEVFDDGRSRISNAKRKVAKLAAIQARDWDDGEFNGRLTGGRKGLRIIVLKGLFNPSSWKPDQEDQILAELEEELRTECQQFGDVEKITVFSKNPSGVVIIKFTQPGAASEAVKAWEGRQWKDIGRIQASYWDGVTDYTVLDEAKEQQEMEKRHEEFGKWLENQDLPDELRLQTE